MSANNSQLSRRYAGGRLSGFVAKWRWRKAAQYASPGAVVLDIACKEGGLISCLPDQIDYLGIDIAEHSISKARTIYSDHNFMIADLSSGLPELAKTFDVVFMLAFIEHITEPQHVLTSIKTLLKPNGRIVLTTPAPWSRPVHEAGSRIGIFNPQAANEHQSFFGRNDIEQIAQQSDLCVEHFSYFMLRLNQLICLTV